jgi:hypothetical protein
MCVLSLMTGSKHPQDGLRQQSRWHLNDPHKLDGDDVVCSVNISQQNDNHRSFCRFLQDAARMQVTPIVNRSQNLRDT